MRDQTGKNTRRSRWLRFLLVPLILIGGVFCALLFNYEQTARSAGEEAETVLLASAREQAGVVGAKIDSQFQLLEVLAASLAVSGDMSASDLSARLQALADSSDFAYVCAADADGQSHFADGSVQDIAKRRYFQESMQGRRAIERLADADELTPKS